MGSENEIAGDDHAHRPARPHADGRLDAEIALDDALTCLIDRVSGAPADGALEIAVTVCAKLCADAENPPARPVEGRRPLLTRKPRASKSTGSSVVERRSWLWRIGRNRRESSGGTRLRFPEYRREA